jgi:hypothetical protein
VGDRLRHRLDILTPNRSQAFEIVLSADSAHEWLIVPNFLNLAQMSGQAIEFDLKVVLRVVRPNIAMLLV